MTVDGYPQSPPIERETSQGADDDRDWLPLDQAAQQLGLHPDTLRRKARRGQIEARQIGTKFGPSWRILVPHHPTLSSPPAGQHYPPSSLPNDPHQPPLSPAPVQGSDPALLEALKMIGHLQTEVVARTEAATLWQARAEMLMGQVQQLQAALEAPKAEQQPPRHEALTGDAMAIVEERSAPADVAMWQTRAEMLADQLDQAHHALRVSAPAPTPASVVKPWWRRVFG